LKISKINDTDQYQLSGNLPLRLLVQGMVTPKATPDMLPLRLFEETDGLFGASGPTMSCHRTTPWHELLKRYSWNAGVMIFDWYAPPQAVYHHGQDAMKPSRIVFNDIDPVFQRRLVWSETKQAGDIVNDAMHEFLMYRPKVCGIDLLFNTSSNWLTVIDTSGPCLILPSFLFDRLRSRVKLKCPFKEGEKSLGQLCSPERGAAGNVSKLPNLYFQLADEEDLSHPQLVLPLDRLMFNNGTDDLLCVARMDDEDAQNMADMMFAQVSFGSLAVAAFYIAVNLHNKTVGLASRGQSSDWSTTEGSDSLCVESIECFSPMQTYYAPRNSCEDPQCSQYLFMLLDDNPRCAFGQVSFRPCLLCCSQL
jgi:hypothetical protein